MSEPNFKVLDERDSHDTLVSRMEPNARTEYLAFGHRKVEPVFIDRLFYTYRAAGGRIDGAKQRPEILYKLRVINFRYTVQTGFLVDILNETTNEKQTVTVMPERLFNQPIYVSVPCSFTLRHNVVVDSRNDMKNFDASAVLYVKTRNRSDFYSKGNIYIETPRNLKNLFPGVELNLGETE